MTVSCGVTTFCTFASVFVPSERFVFTICKLPPLCTLKGFNCNDNGNSLLVAKERTTNVEHNGLDVLMHPGKGNRSWGMRT